MKTIIAGPRDYSDYDDFCQHIEKVTWTITSVVSGGCQWGKPNRQNTDQMGERWCREFLNKEPEVYPAEWDKRGLRAGPLRNAGMASIPTVTHCIVFWDGKTKKSGSRDMINKAIMHSLTLKVFHI